MIPSTYLCHKHTFNMDQLMFCQTCMIQPLFRLPRQDIKHGLTSDCVSGTTEQCSSIRATLAPSIGKGAAKITAQKRTKIHLAKEIDY